MWPALVDSTGVDLLIIVLVALGAVFQLSGIVVVANRGADLKTWWHDYVEMRRARILNRRDRVRHFFTGAPILNRGVVHVSHTLAASWISKPTEDIRNDVEKLRRELQSVRTEMWHIEARMSVAVKSSGRGVFLLVIGLGCSSAAAIIALYT
jgi:hypothetical protein